MQLLHIIALLFHRNFIVHTANFIFFDNLSKKLIVIKCEVKTIKKNWLKSFLNSCKSKRIFLPEKNSKEKIYKT